MTISNLHNPQAFVHQDSDLNWPYPTNPAQTMYCLVPYTLQKIGQKIVAVGKPVLSHATETPHSNEPIEFKEMARSTHTYSSNGSLLAQFAQEGTFVVPRLNPQEIRTFRKISERSLLSYQTRAHDLLAFDFQQLIRPHQGDDLFNQFKDKFSEQLVRLDATYQQYQIVIKSNLDCRPDTPLPAAISYSTEINTLSKIIDLIAKKVSDQPIKEVADFWKYQLSLPSYITLFQAMPLQDHPQLSSLYSEIEPENKRLRDYLSYLSATHKLDLPKNLIDGDHKSAYQYALEQYKNNRASGELYESFINRMEMSIFLDSLQKVPEKLSVMTLQRDIGWREVLNILLISAKADGFESFPAQQLACERLFKGLQFLVEDRPSIGFSELESLYSSTQSHALNKYETSMKKENRAAKNQIRTFVELIKANTQFTEVLYKTAFRNLFDFVRHIEGNISLRQLTDQILTTHQKLIGKGLLESEKMQEDFDQVLSSLYDLLEFQRMLYTLRDFSIPPEEDITQLDLLERLERQALLFQSPKREAIIQENLPHPLPIAKPTAEPTLKRVEENKEEEFQPLQTPDNPKPRRILADLKTFGFFSLGHKRGKGSHEIFQHWQHADLQVVVSFHSGSGSLKKGTLESIYDVIREAQKRGNS